MRSLGQLGIKLNWEFCFLEKGMSPKPLSNQILVDLGSSLEYGIIDIKQGGTIYDSIPSAIAGNPHLILVHLLERLNLEYASGRPLSIDEITFCFCTHRGPGWDSMAALYLCDELLKNGRFPIGTQWLVNISDEISQARLKTNGHVNRPIMIYYAISANADSDKDKLLAGLNLIKKTIDFGRKNNVRYEHSNPFYEPVDDLKQIFPEFQNHAEMLEQDYSLYEDDLANVECFQAELPPRDCEYYGHISSKESVRAASVMAFTQLPKSKLFRFWVRDGLEHDLLMTPASPDPNHLHSFRNWRISLDPNRTIFTLRRLGYVLEALETEARLENGRVRRGHPRFPSGYCDNNDPWYDGRNHDYFMVESPRSGTDLSYKKIKSVLTGRFHGIELPEQDAKSLIFYHFFEFDDSEHEGENLIDRLEKAGFEKKKPLAELNSSYQFVQDVEIWGKKVFEEQSNFSASLWVSEITKHAILELTVNEFPPIKPAKSSSRIMFNELRDFISIKRNEAYKIARKTTETKELQLNQKIWGRECYTFIKLRELSLDTFHDPLAYQRILNHTLKADFKLEQIEQLTKSSGVPEDYFSTSKAICLFGNKIALTTVSDIDFRDTCLLYALFLKTGYRNFSQRIGNITEKINPIPSQTPSASFLKWANIFRIFSKSKASTNADLMLGLQRDYSLFLARYDFSENEINQDPQVQSYFMKALSALGMKDQKEETIHEMRTTFDFAAAKDRQRSAKSRLRLQYILLWVGILAIGDFLFAWLGENEYRALKFFTENERGAIIFTILSIAAIFVSYRISVGDKDK